MNGEIEQNQRATYLNEFSKRNRMRSVRLQLVGEEIGAQEEAQHLPLTGVSLDKGDGALRVEIMLGGQTAADTRHLAHTVASVERTIKNPAHSRGAQVRHNVRPYCALSTD